MRYFKYWFLITALLWSYTAFAATDDSDQIIVTANRGATPLSQIGKSVTVIAADEIERRQTVALVDLLRTVPGVVFTRNGGVGATTSVYIRGAESDQTVALIDGVKLNDPSAPGGGFNFGNLLTGNISRIEVVRGAQSVLWGSQAIGGVVNVITRSPTDMFTVNANAEYGWRDTVQLAGNVSGKFGPISASVGAGYLGSAGVSTYSEQRGATERDGYKNVGANAKVTIALSDAVSVDLRSWYSRAKTGFDAVYIPADSLETSKTEEFVGYTGLNAALFGSRFKNRIAYAQTVTVRQDLDLSGIVPLPTFEAKGTNERLEYQGRFEISDRYALTFGVENERSSYRAASFGGPVARASALLTSVYGEARATPVDGLTITAGVRHDQSRVFGGKTVLAGNAVYSPNGGATTFRASYGEGFKVPSLYQLFSEYGNLALDPEASKGWDAGIVQKALSGAIEVGATWFSRATRNQIIFVGCGAQTGICTNRPFGTYDNVARARAKGIEAGITLQPVNALTARGSYTWIDTVDDINGRKLARRPAQSMNASIDYRFGNGVETGATLVHVGNSFDDAANLQRLSGYALVDLRVSVPLGKAISLYGRIENLFDEKYEMIFLYGTPGRAAYGGIRVGF